MGIKKVLIACLILAAFGSASVMSAGGLGLGDNPAAPGVEKEKAKVETGFTLFSNTLSDKDTLYRNSLNYNTIKAKNVTEGMGGLWASWTDKFQDFWYTVKYANGTGMGKGFSSKNDFGTKRVTLTEDQSEKLTFGIARDFAEFGGFTGGVNLGINTDRTKGISTVSSPGTKKYEIVSGAESDAYLTVALGLAKNLDSKSKVIVGQTLPTTKTVKDNDTTVDGKKTIDGGRGYNDFVAAETAVSYIYKFDKNLEFAGTLAHNWGGKFDWQQFDKNGNDVGPEREIEYLPYDTIGIAASYLYSDFEFVGYANFINDAEITVMDDNRVDTTNPFDKTYYYYGVDTTVLGVSAFWNLAKAGTIGLNIENSRRVGGRDVTDSTTTALSYKYLF